MPSPALILGGISLAGSLLSGGSDLPEVDPRLEGIIKELEGQLGQGLPPELRRKILQQGALQIGAGTASATDQAARALSGAGGANSPALGNIIAEINRNANLGRSNLATNVGKLDAQFNQQTLQNLLGAIQTQFGQQTGRFNAQEQTRPDFGSALGASVLAETINRN
jgi:hypothetical protein